MGTRCYVGRLPYRAGERDLERFFRGYGKLNEVILKNGYAFVEFAEFRDADDAAHDLNGRELLGDRIIVELAQGTPRGRDRNGWRPPPRSSRDDRRGYGSGGGNNRSRRGGETERTNHRIKIDNLSSRTTWQDIKDFFRTVGEVTYADTHRSKRQGIVEFATREDMKKALEKMDNKELQGRKLKLAEDKGSSRRGGRSRSSSKEGKSSRSRSRSHSGSGGDRSRSPPINDKRNKDDDEKKKNGRKDDDVTAVTDGKHHHSGDEHSGDEDSKHNDADRKRGRSASGGSKSPTDADNDHHGKNDGAEAQSSPPSKRQRGDSEKSAEDAEGATAAAGGPDDDDDDEDDD